ncbi:GntR family transcriptional regulator [Clostridium cylindrosporum]|uniref:Transcriptional regulator, GntR family n=1 Tax=Clostridium cylindrosporum DSM 605 TaxID=1121307 RepID=A0A0J8D5P9_CLOCY|nr:GntR family transcriptional regulator [Clostridium cylindrosporum]KMT21177.1 transcriptional regulator, GntR family [Clostridium cylindrosporum DSM 605]
MNIIINFESDVPIYIQIRNEIVKGIASGNLEDGYSLPSVRAFAEDIGINMHTVNKAYNMLKSEGYIVLDRRHGAFVSVSRISEEDEKRFNDELRVIVSSCLAKGMKKEDIVSIVQSICNEMRGENE